MREIITVSCGQAGNQINQEFWKTITMEHGVNSDGRMMCDKEC